MLTPNEIHTILERTRIAKERKEMRAEREEKYKIVSTWDRSEHWARPAVDTILDVYEDLKLHPGAQTLEQMNRRLSVFANKISQAIVILEREGWVEVIRDVKPYAYRVIK